MTQVKSEERDKMVLLAKKGNQDAIKFLRETTNFLKTGKRATACLKILAESGDDVSRRRYQTIQAVAKKGKAKQRRKKSLLPSKELTCRTRAVRRVHADEDEVMRMLQAGGEEAADASEADDEDEEYILSYQHEPHDNSIEDNGTSEIPLGTSQTGDQGLENADANQVRERHLNERQTNSTSRFQRPAMSLGTSSETSNTLSARTRTTQQRPVNTECNTLGAMSEEQGDGIIVSRTKHARKIKKEAQIPEVITIDDDDTVSGPLSNQGSDISLLYCEWEENEAKASSKQPEMEIKKYDLEAKMGILQTQNTFKSEGRLQFMGSDDNHWNEIELTVLSADIVYYESLAAFARVRLTCIEQGQGTDISPELRRITFEANKAYHDGRAAFAKLKDLFPATKSMERPAALENWCA